VADHSEPNGVAELTVKIVSAYVSNNAIAESELPELITTVASRLRHGSAVAEQPAEEKPELAVSVRRSIRPAAEVRAANRSSYQRKCFKSPPRFSEII
jgi:MucR family transcriptional regulator, transcriptional regulator of exopolysaccharide biosynthesis